MFSYEPVAAWTQTIRTTGLVARVTDAEGVRAALREASRRGLTVIPRGSGLSYADQIINRPGAILDTRGMNRIIDWNPDTGVLVAEPGVTCAAALMRCLPDNWVLPAVPGIRTPTLGGIVANNAHGKNAWRDGAIGESVLRFTLLAGDGRVYQCSRSENRDLYEATVGGMGLLGVFLEIAIQCKRIPSPFLEVRHWTVPTLAAMLDDFARVRDAVDHHIAWMDCFATGARLGRGTIHTASFVEAPRGRAIGNADLREIPPRFGGVFPRRWLWPIIRPAFGNALMRTVNTAKFAADALTAGRRIQHYFEFNFLLDKIPDWRQLFLPHGYLELEPLVPFSRASAVIAELTTLTHRYGVPSYLCGVKSHRRDPFMLGFSGDGVSLGIDIPIDPSRRAELNRLFYDMTEVVVRAGGRIYLAKDEQLAPEHFVAMYPRLAEFQAVKRRVDPDDLFQSDMYRRLLVAVPAPALVGATAGRNP